VLHVHENDTLSQAARLTLYSNLPITCQYSIRNRPQFCWLKFSIHSDTGDVVVRQLVPGNPSSSRSRSCVYLLDEADWKPDEGFAYNFSKPLQIIAKVGRVAVSFLYIGLLQQFSTPVLFPDRMCNQPTFIT